MSPLELDARFTFDTFIVGAANRLATAAARRVADSPGATYNPLFVYSASGLGKTHLVSAIGHHARRVYPEIQVVFDTLEQFMGDIMAAIEAGERDAFRTRVGDVGLLILDDVQFLAGRHRTQEELLRIWDAISARGGQVVLTSDRPPHEIDGLDERLLSRFSGGLIVDIGAPDYETRVAIVRRKSAERDQALAAGVAEALARIAFGNVRELMGGLNRLLAVQELEGRAVAADEVPKILGVAGGEGDEFEAFLAEISDTVSEIVRSTAAERRLADAILRWEGEGYRTRRLDAALQAGVEDDGVEAVIRAFEADVERLREIAGEISALEPDAPELIRRDVLRDPDRLDEAEALLGEVRERTRPLPPPPEGFTFERLALSPDLFAVRAAIAAAEQPASRYNPFYVYGPAGSGRSALLAALGERLQRAAPDEPIAYVDGAEFAAELIQALERNRVDGWRARYRRARALLLDDVDALAGTERAQEELFHLFDALQRAGAQLAFTASRPPQELDGIEERLRTRLESGLVVELPAADRAEGALIGAGDGGPSAAAAPAEAPAKAAGAGGDPDPAAAVAAPGEGDAAEARGGPDPWFLSREKVLWTWPYCEDRLIEDWD
ncbi:MAG TPA: DnaA/Hda family protein [Longimicrobiales bacterium]